MDIRHFTRDAGRIHACLKELPDNSLVALKRLRLYIPTRFEERDLAIISNEILICGIFALVNDDNFYCISTVNAMIRISPTVINTVKIEGESYYEFIFEPGSTVIPNLDLLKDDVVTYYIFDEFFAKGRVPWYIGYDDLGSIFDTSSKHAGVSFGNNREIIELITSIVARDPDNRYQMYRHVIKDRGTLLNKPPTYVPLDAIQFTATNTTSKLVGAYMADGVVSALVNPSERQERIESLLTQ